MFVADINDVSVHAKARHEEAENPIKSRQKIKTIEHEENFIYFGPIPCTNRM